MAAKDVGRSESVPKRPRISSVHSETADLRQRLESSFPLDALLPTLHLENVLTDYEFNQLLPTPQSALVHRNRRFLDYLGNKDPSTISDTLSVLFRPEYETYGYFGEMLRQLFGVEGKEREGMRENTSHKPQPKWERGRGAKETTSTPTGALSPPPQCSAPESDYEVVNMSGSMTIFQIAAEPSISLQSTAVDPSLTPVCKDEDVPLSVGLAQRGGVAPLIPTIPNSEDGELSLKANEVLAQEVHGRSDHLVLLRRYVSRQAWGKGRALLEVLGLTTAQIAQCYSMHPLNEEESVQDGLQVWIKGGRNTNWGDLLRAMGTAGIAIQQCDGLKVELCSNTGSESDYEVSMPGSVTTFPMAAEPSIGLQSTAVDPSFTPVCKNYDVSLSAGVAQGGRVTQLISAIPHSEDKKPSLKANKILAEEVHGRSDHLVLLRRYVSRQAWDKGRALLEALGLTAAQIDQCYGMHPLNEEESVQYGLQAWIKGGRNTNWGDLLRAMETAGIAIQQCDGLKEELCSNTIILEGKGLAGITRHKSLRAKLGCYYSKECIQDNPLLTSSTMQYVKLNLVQPKQRKPVVGRVDEAVAVHLARGGIEQVPQMKVPLDYKDILSYSTPAGISRQRILIEGVPGSGKSTLVQRMCHDWSVSHFANKYDVVIQVTLRSLPKDQALSLEDLIFTSVGDAHIVQEVADFVSENQGQEVLFIFDGFDELSEEMREKSVVRDIIAGRLAPYSSFVVTTRPISAESLYHFVDRRVEVCGFGEEEVVKYITEYFASSNPSAGEKLLSTVSLRPHIKQLCYVPLLLLMICYTASLGGDSPELPDTLHQLFESLIILTINHNLERAGQRRHAGSLQDVWRLCASFEKLTQLALQGIEKDTIIFPDLNFEVDSALHGLFNCIEARNRFGVITQTWHFLHLTLQEFMAALAVARKTPEEQVTFWKKHLTLRYNKEGQFILADDRYRMMFMFYCGLTGLSNPGIQSMLLHILDFNTVVKPSISRGSQFPELCTAVAESSNEHLARSILSPCGPTVKIGRGYLKDVGIAWCVGHYCKQMDGAGIKFEEGLGGVANFISQLGDISTLARVELPDLGYKDQATVRQFLLKQTQLRCVMFEDLKNTEDTIDTLKDVLTHHKESLEDVALLRKFGRGDRVPVDPLVDSLVTCLKLTSLALDDVSLSLKNLLAVVKSLHNLRVIRLKEVSLSDEGSLTASDVHLIASSVEHHRSLRELTVEGCSESLAKGAVEGLARRNVVEKLVVTPYEWIDPALVPPICAVMRTVSLNTFSIGGLYIPDQVEQVLEELHHCTRLKELTLGLGLPLSDKIITLPSAVEAGLSKCTTLQKLTVGAHYRSVIPPSVTAALLKAVAVSRSLEEVSLDRCDFDGVAENMVGFVSYSNEVNKLRKVQMTWCVNLPPFLVAIICGGLCRNSLEELEVTNQRGEVEGEDVSDPSMLQSVEAAIRDNKSVKRIMIDGPHMQWINVATAILKGAAQKTSLKELELVTPKDLPPPQEVVDDVRRANPRLRLVVRARGRFL